jgi:hypothetical protein
MSPEKPTGVEVAGAIEILRPEMEVKPQVIDARLPVVYGTNNPARILEQAQQIAGLLTPIVRKQGLFKRIGTREFVFCEGWTTMLAMLGIFPHVVWSRRIPHESACIYEARVALRTGTGHEVGAAESMCSSMEEHWGDRDEYAIRSMAETRAVGKACRLGFSWIMVLAGFAPTPAEEMKEEYAERTERPPAAQKPPTPPKETPKPPPAPQKAKAQTPSPQTGKEKEPERLKGSVREKWIPPYEHIQYLEILHSSLTPDERQKSIDWCYSKEHQNSDSWSRQTRRVMSILKERGIDFPPPPPKVISAAIEELENEVIP